MIENNLLVLVLVTGAVGLLVPRLGQFLSGAVTPMLALLMLAVVCLVLNVGGYVLATAAWPLSPARGDRTAMLFTVSKKEFSIAAVVVVSTGLPAEVALPAVIYAVVQMLTSPVVANVAARRASTPP